MRRAGRLADYYRAHALAAFDAMRADPIVADAECVLEVIRRIGRPVVSTRDVFTVASRSRFAKVGDLEPPLAMLEDHGYISPAPQPERAEKRGRKPSPLWAVNPQVVPAQTTETAERRGGHDFRGSAVPRFRGFCGFYGDLTTAIELLPAIHSTRRNHEVETTRARNGMTRRLVDALAFDGHPVSVDMADLWLQHAAGPWLRRWTRQTAPATRSSRCRRWHTPGSTPSNPGSRPSTRVGRRVFLADFERASWA